MNKPWDVCPKCLHTIEDGIWSCPFCSKPLNINLDLILKDLEQKCEFIRALNVKRRNREVPSRLTKLTKKVSSQPVMTANENIKG